MLLDCEQSIINCPILSRTDNGGVKKKAREVFMNRWATIIHSHIHAAARRLHPRAVGDPFPGDEEGQKAMYVMWPNFYPEQEQRDRAKEQYSKFWMTGKLAMAFDQYKGFKTLDELETCVTEAKREVERVREGHKHELVWWEECGWLLPDLKVMAMKLLAQPATSAACERNFSAFGRVQSVRRRRLGYKQLEDLVFCNANLKLLGPRKARSQRPMKIDAGVIDDAGQEFGLPREFYSVAEWGAHARDGHFLADADELEQDPNFAAVEEGEMWDSDDDPNDLDY